MWLSFTSSADERSMRWFWPPPQRTAYFSSGPQPGQVLRVSRTTAPVPATSSTSAAVMVAIPDRCVTMLNRVRSAANRVSAGPVNVAEDCLRLDPSAVIHLELGTRHGRSRAGRSPRRAPFGRLQGRRWCQVAWGLWTRWAGRDPTAAPVGSPSGRSSATARAIISRRSGQGGSIELNPPRQSGTTASWCSDGTTLSSPVPISPSASTWATCRTCHVGVSVRVVRAPVSAPRLTPPGRQRRDYPRGQGHVGQLPRLRAADGPAGRAAAR